MSRLDELIQEYCPDGVEYKPLEELAEIGTGSHNTSEEIDDGAYPFFVRSQDIRSLNTYDFDECAIITAGDGVGVGKVFHLVNGKYALHQRAYRIHITYPNLLPEFVFQYMKATFLNYIQEASFHSSVTSVRKPMLFKYAVPVPPLPVQEEIVRISDTFTELTSELTGKLAAELAARKKQYEYYRDIILSLPDYRGEIKTYSLCELVTQKITDGMHNLPKSVLSEGYAPILSAANIYDGILHFDTKKYVNEDVFKQENKRTAVDVGDLLLTIVATIGRVVVIKEPVNILLQRSVAVIKPNKDIISSDYLRFYLETNAIQHYMQKHSHGGAQKGFYVNQLNDLKITIPTDLKEQERIVSILNRFDTLCNDISACLPAEIEDRQKQYEYYRDKLLTFKELKS